MKNNKTIYIFIIVAIILAIAGFYGIKYLKNKQVSSQIEEYVPQEEINESQKQKAMVNLYFYNNEIGKLETEARLVDAIEVLENPYNVLIQMLIDGPKSDKLNSLMPDGVKLINAAIYNGCVTVDLTSEFLNYTEDKDLKNNMINSIVNTLTELTEVDSVKFLINSKPNDEFSEEYVRI